MMVFTEKEKKISNLALKNNNPTQFNGTKHEKNLSL